MENTRAARNRIAAFTLSLLCCLPAGASAFEIGVGASALQLPADGWFRTNVSLDLTVPASSEAAVTAVLGAAPPYSIADYTQQIAFGALLGEWRPARSGKWLGFSAGAGLGAYLDQVGSAGGWVPSLVTRAGVRTLGGRFGVHAHFECYAGIYSTEQLGSYVIWPMSRVVGGIHASF